MNLNDIDKTQIIELIKAGEKLPKEFIYKLFSDEEDVFLFWNGRKEDITNIALPFHSIEHIDEPRKEADKPQTSLFETDFRGRQLKGWTNKLIWGDNKLILSSLANGPIREEIEKEGGLKLIYIDPPFAVGADFGFNIEIGGETAEKKQSIIEEIAYRDTWGKGISSYLSMMYERLKIMYNLLSDDGSLFLHCDQRTNAPLRFIVQDVFGYEFFKNEIVWQRTSAGKTVSGNLPKNCDYLLWSTKSDNFKFKGFYGELTEQNIKVFNKDDKDGRGLYRTQPVIKTSNPGPQTTYDYVDNQGRVWKCPRKGWRFNKERMKALENDNRLIFTSVISEKYYLKERMEIGRQLSNLWSDISGNTVAFSGESVDYPTQKPEKLLERIINSLTDEKDLVADFFVVVAQPQP
jgi:adenine-specific DNA-methyltransferase